MNQLKLAINSTAELNKNNFEIVVVGTSLGGLQALTVLLADLPQSFPLPVVIVQHRHKSSQDRLMFYNSKALSKSQRHKTKSRSPRDGFIWLLLTITCS